MGVEQTLAHIPALRRYARLLTGDAARADDLVQDTLERACAKWSLWQPGSVLRSWLLTMMHHVHANQRRDGRHEAGHLSLDEAPEPAHEPQAGTEARLDLQQALRALPDPMREVLLLVAVEEYTYAEAARILDVPVGTVMSRLHRARERLRELLSAGGDSPAPPGPPVAAPLQLVKR